MVSESLKCLKNFMARPLTGKLGRVCNVIVHSLLLLYLVVLVLGVVLFTLSPQFHWIVFVARGSPEPPKNFTGTWRTWLGGGQLVAQEQYLRGKLDGLSIRWDIQGQGRLEASYRDGNLNGLWRIIGQDGSIANSLEYADGKPAGHWIGFYPNGSTNFEMFHSRPGARDGPEVSWTRAGEKRVSRVWRDGQPWEGKFWSNYNGDSILRVYENGRFLSETNMGRLNPPRSPGLKKRNLEKEVP